MKDAVKDARADTAGAWVGGGGEGRRDEEWALVDDDVVSLLSQEQVPLCVTSSCYEFVL